MSTCATCHHWLPAETLVWAARMSMACCAKKNTKAITVSHRHWCALFQVASDEAVAKKRALVRRLMADAPPAF